MTQPTVPDSAKPYVDILGEELAIKFFMTFGGAELYFATNPRSSSRLVQVVGKKNAVKLAEANVSLKSRVPIPKKWIAAVWSSKNLSDAEIARRLHVTDVTLRRWRQNGQDTRSKTATDPRQPRLI